MQSNFSHMSEAEEFSRMSELAEVSDEEDYEYDDIPEEVNELEPSQDLDMEPWRDVNFERTGEDHVTANVDQNATKTKSKPYVNHKSKLKKIVNV